MEEGALGDLADLVRVEGGLLRHQTGGEARKVQVQATAEIVRWKTTGKGVWGQPELAKKIVWDPNPRSHL